jgi:hypothetical protein
MGDIISEKNGSEKLYICVLMSRSLELSDTVTSAPSATLLGYRSQAAANNSDEDLKAATDHHADYHYSM